MGWAQGSEEFRKELLGRMNARVGRSHYGAELRETEEEKAGRIIAEEIGKLKFAPAGSWNKPFSFRCSRCEKRKGEKGSVPGTDPNGAKIAQERFSGICRDAEFL